MKTIIVVQHLRRHAHQLAAFFFLVSLLAAVCKLAGAAQYPSNFLLDGLFLVSSCLFLASLAFLPEPTE